MAQQHRTIFGHQDSKRMELDIEFDRLFSLHASKPVDEIRPAPRRAFKKSRKGCRTCKERKVKCDEKHPLCGNCFKRFPGIRACDFEPSITISEKKIDVSPRGARRPNHPMGTSIGPSITTQPTGTSHVEGLRVLELRLMHHYTTSTCRHLPDARSLKANYVWSIDIPRLAFQSDLVLNALLAISALHYWALTPDDTKLSYAAGFYFDKAVKAHRMALSQVDQVSAESVLATAILITHYTWLAGHSNTSNAPYELQLQTYHMARGIQVLFDQMWPWLNGSGYLWYVHRPGAAVRQQVNSTDYFFISSQEDLATLSLTFEDEDVSPNDKSVYKKTVRELLSMGLAICNSESEVSLQRGVATMPLRLPERFLQLAEMKDPRALALLARNLALLKVIEPVWWLHGTGPSQNVAESAVVGISKIIPADWAWVMEWPFKVMSGRLRPSNGSISGGGVSDSHDLEIRAKPE